MTTPLPRAAKGVMDGSVHRLPVRVYYEETDAGRMVYHAAYLKFAERARTEMMRLCGLDHITMMEEDGLVFTVHSADIRYKRQAKLDDELIVSTQVAGLSGASMTMAQTVSRIENDALGPTIAELDLKLAVVDMAGRPVRLPQALKDTLERLRPDKG